MTNTTRGLKSKDIAVNRSRRTWKGRHIVLTQHVRSFCLVASSSTHRAGTPTPSSAPLHLACGVPSYMRRRCHPGTTWTIWRQQQNQTEVNTMRICECLFRIEDALQYTNLFSGKERDGTRGRVGRFKAKLEEGSSIVYGGTDEVHLIRFLKGGAVIVRRAGDLDNQKSVAPCIMHVRGVSSFARQPRDAPDTTTTATT